MVERFPKKVYGRCPIGHNMAPSGTTGDNISTTQIDEGEEQPLYWSTYYQKYICKFCERRVQDIKDEGKFHEKQLEVERKLSGMGFLKS